VRVAECDGESEWRRRFESSVAKEKQRLSNTAPTTGLTRDEGVARLVLLLAVAVGGAAALTADDSLWLVGTAVVVCLVVVSTTIVLYFQRRSRT
jgi:hypothetical protein